MLLRISDIELGEEVADVAVVTQMSARGRGRIVVDLDAEELAAV